MKHPSLGGQHFWEAAALTHCTQSVSHFAAAQDNQHDQGPRAQQSNHNGQRGLGEHRKMIRKSTSHIDTTWALDMETVGNTLS